jgi:hypothetical protein
MSFILLIHYFGQVFNFSSHLFAGKGDCYTFIPLFNFKRTGTATVPGCFLPMERNSYQLPQTRGTKFSSSKLSTAEFLLNSIVFQGTWLNLPSWYPQVLSLDEPSFSSGQLLKLACNWKD